MRTCAFLLVFLVSAAFASAETYYLFPFEDVDEQGRTEDRLVVERAEIDIEGDAFVFDPGSPELRRYLEDRKLTDKAIREKLFPELRFSYFCVVRAEKKADFTVKLGETQRDIFASQAATGNAEKIADNYRILCLCWFYEQLAEMNAPGWPIFQELQYHFDDILFERLKGAGLKVQRRDGFRTVTQRRRQSTNNDIARQFDLFSGAAAIRGNLDLFTLPDFKDGNARTVDIKSIKGITVAEVDWKALLAEVKTPKLDPLAKYVPEDQHFVVFPSVQAALKMFEAVEKSGLTALAAPIPMFFETMSGAEPMHVQRYSEQLGLTPEIFEKLAASPNVKTVAITGSDPYFKEGTDVAVLFETTDPASLLSLLGESSGRRIVEKITEKIVLLTNSPYQVKRIKSTVKSGKSLARLDEFRYFRDRYKVGDAEETAFVYLSDATIRRWCSPRWRIGQARRLMQQARIAEITADRLSKLVYVDFNRSEIISPWHEDMVVEPELQKEYRYSLSLNGAEHAIYGTFSSLTPIAELPLNKVSVAEKEAYELWRDEYEATLRGVFDPICIRLTLDKTSIKTDLTVLPVKVTSIQEFGWMLEATEGGKLASAAKSYDVPLQFIAALNTNAAFFQSISDFAKENDERFMPSWVGNYISLYFDEDPFWDSLAKQIEKVGIEGDWGPESFGGEWNMPVVLEIDSKDKEMLDDFVAAVMEPIRMLSGDIIVKKSKHGNKSYLSLRAKNKDSSFGKVSFFIATEKNRLLVSLNENTLKRAMDRQSGKTKEKAAWLGSNFGMKLDHRAIHALEMLFQPAIDLAVQQSIIRNRELFEFYKLRYPTVDAVLVHQRLFGERLLRPEETPRTTPLSDVMSAEFGITLENGGLRARGEVHWKQPKERKAK